MALGSLTSDNVRWLARLGVLRSTMQASVLSELASGISLNAEDQQEALNQFREEHQIRDAESQATFLEQNLLEAADLQAIAERPIRLAQHIQEHFAHKAEARFLQRKDQLDRVVYSLLRLEDQHLARELYLQIQEGEADFAELAAQFAEGPEKATRGVVGPVPLSQAHPTLALRLRSAELGKLMEPFPVERWWLVVRLERQIPASFDASTGQQMARELFETWLQEEVDQRMAALRQTAPSPGALTP